MGNRNGISTLTNCGDFSPTLLVNLSMFLVSMLFIYFTVVLFFFLQFDYILLNLILFFVKDNLSILKQ